MDTASTSAVTLEDLQATSDISTSLESHIHYPTIINTTYDEDDSSNKQPESRQVHQDRLYIGNLHPSVDEYSLFQVFQKFGKITKLDFLFHKAGALKGKPRGYAFIEYADPDDALRAMTMAHDKPLRGRKITVTFAHQAPLEHYTGTGSTFSTKSRRSVMEIARPTTLSLLKTGITGRHGHEGKTGDKIALMEAKLRQMESSKPKAATSNDVHESNDSSHSAFPSSSTLPTHPSLPVKPPPALPPHLQQSLAKKLPNSSPTPSLLSKSHSILPSLPITSSPSGSHSTPTTSGSKHFGAAALIKTPSTGSGPSNLGKLAKPKLLGVKIKHKEKDKIAKV